MENVQLPDGLESQLRLGLTRHCVWKKVAGVTHFRLDRVKMSPLGKSGWLVDRVIWVVVVPKYFVVLGVMQVLLVKQLLPTFGQLVVSI